MKIPKSIRVALAAILLCVNFTSCEKEPILTLSLQGITAPSPGNSTNVIVNANNPWTVSGSDWCTVSPSSGEDGEVSVTVTVKENNTYDTRNCTLTFTSEGLMASISVSQESNYGIVLPKDTFEVSSDAQQISVEVKANVEYDIETEADWITQSGTKALASASYIFNVTENTSYEGREGLITIKEKNNNAVETIKVKQSQKDTIIISKNEYEVRAEGDTIEVGLYSNVDFNISIKESWVRHIEWQSTRSLAEHKLFFLIGENESDQERSSRIIFTNKASEHTEVVTIKQKSQKDDVPYLTFMAESEQTLTMSKTVETLEYSVNDGDWVTLGTNTVSFGAGYGNLRLRGKSPIGTALSKSDYATISFGNDVKVSCTGDIRTLVDYENYAIADMNNARFCRFFRNCANLTTAPKLPATTLADYCYFIMFEGCTSLTTAPELPAVTLTDKCYSSMFRGCTSLTSAPKLPATTLANSCYSQMFEGCTSLTTAPELPAVTLTDNCYFRMFRGCSSLTTAPELTATALAYSCYCVMFLGCTSLVTAPELPATTLADYCYDSMFSGCTSLTSAPKLPATTLANSCYGYMFEGCTSLITAPELPATTLADYCYYTMFEGCTSLTTAPELPAVTLTDNCYESMFSGCTSLTAVPKLSATALASSCYRKMFQGCTSLTKTQEELPAMVLEFECYSSMFQGCTNLTAAPKLPATSLGFICYSHMFEGCTSLTTAPELPATILNEGCYSTMFQGCTSLTSAPKLPATTLANSCYQSMFKDCTSLTEAPDLPATTLADWCYSYMFQGCTRLNRVTMTATDISASKCLYNWLDKVSLTGKFTKNASTYIEYGPSGIPNGWEVTYYENN